MSAEMIDNNESASLQPDDELNKIQRRTSRRSMVEPCIVMMTVLAVGFVMSKASQVAIPFMLAFLLTMIFVPVIKLGEPHRIPTGIMILVVMALVLSILMPFGIFLNTLMQSMMRTLPDYYNKLVDIGRSFLEHYDLPREFWVTINWYNTVGRYVSGMTGFLLNWIGTLTMTMVFLVFMLLETPYMEKRIRMAFRGDGGERISSIADKVLGQISKYLRTLTVISFVTGVCVFLILSAIGIDFAMTWGVLAFFLNFIPTLGSIAASLPPILIALVQYYPSWWPSILTMVALLAIQFSIGNIMTPKIMGDTLDLSPVIILISLLFWGLIWGLSGALLSVPITVMIKIICENVPRLNFVAMLMCSAKDGRRGDGQ
ncbi:MAG: AI-2E family transporter [Synergistaceae bacterium]|jgi:predicted PurR-regulated permease PerM|nr:AI-2E family transporter [Synergistaceae bacterium]